MLTINNAVVLTFDYILYTFSLLTTEYLLDTVLDWTIIGPPASTTLYDSTIQTSTLETQSSCAPVPYKKFCFFQN